MSTQKTKSKKAKNFCTAFVCIAFLIFGAIHLFSCGNISYDSVVGLFIKIVPACLVMGVLGYKIGDILDHPKGSKAADYRNIIMDELENIDANMDFSGLSTDFPDFGEINAKLISEGQAEEPKIEMTEESSE
ncbi:hypothetical protein IJI31_05645 [bacterium]|nr:hypothetical protein [bacterium]